MFWAASFYPKDKNPKQDAFLPSERKTEQPFSRSRGQKNCIN